MAQNEPSILQFLKNTTIQIDSNEINLIDLFDKNQEILFHAEKLQADVDSLVLEIQKRDAEINARELLYQNQIKRDTLQSQVYYILKDKYTSLEKDYTKLKKGKKLNGVLGGGISANYSLDTQNINSIALNINLGLMFKQKYITTLEMGFNLNRELIIGLNGGLVF